MRRTLPLVCSSVLVVALVLFAAEQVTGRAHSANAQPLISSPGFHCVSWGVVNSPNVSGESNSLDGVSARSDTDVWAVGYATASGFEQPLIEHFDGTSWSIVPNPGPAPLFGQLNGVSALSANDVWAVGKFLYAGQSDQPLIIHWDGTSWSTVSAPMYTYGGQLSAIAAISASDIWVAGSASPNPTGDVSLLEHWDGTSWAVVPSPNPSDESNGPALSALVAVSSTDVWAAGSYRNQSNVDQTLAMHWDGNVWSIVSTPNAPNATYGNNLLGVAALASNDVWAVGYVDIDPNTGAGPSLVEHWNGSTWSIVANPNRGISSALNAASAIPDTHTVWAAGSYFDATTHTLYPLTERWNGRTWSIVSTPTASSAVTSGLSAISAITPTDAWAGGWFSVPVSLRTSARGHHSMSSTGARTLSPAAPFSAAYQEDTLTEHYAPRSTPTGACPL